MPSAIMIKLPHGGPGRTFDAWDAVRHMRDKKIDCWVQGQVNCARKDHPKPESLDCWLRDNHAANPDTKQAVNEVLDDLFHTGLFEPCRTSDDCKGIKLTQKALKG
jgi:hypothetical protein